MFTCNDIKAQKRNTSFKQIQYDLRSGIGSCWLKYAISALIFFIVCFDLWKNVHVSQMISNSSITFADYLLYAFKGMNVFKPNLNDPENSFQVPAFWLLINLYLAYLVGDYPSRDLGGYGKQILIRSKTRGQWWLGKVTWNAVSVLIYYAIGYLVMIGFSLATGRVSGNPSVDIARYFLSMEVSGLNGTCWIPAAIIQPILASLSICLIQMTISLFMKPIMSFAAIACILVASAYYFTPFLIGNCLMIARSSLVRPDGIGFVFAAFLTVLLSAAAVVIGGMKFQRMDIFE